MSVSDSTAAAKPALKKKMSCRFVGGPMYFEEQVYPKPNNYFFGPIICWWTVLSIWNFAYLGWTDPTLMGYLKGVAWHIPPYILDVLTSDAHWYNMKRLKYHGYSSLVVYSNIIYHGMAGMLGQFMTPAQYRLNYPDMILIKDSDWYSPSFYGVLIMRILMVFVISDLIFYVLHKFMHRYFPKLHFMHHVCVKPSMTAAIIIHPLDFLIEAIGITVAAWMMWAVFNDPLAHIISAPLAVSWYHAGHDEWWNNMHARHHANCNSDYWSYNPVHNKADSKDAVRTLVFQHEVKQD